MSCFAVRSVQLSVESISFVFTVECITFLATSFQLDQSIGGAKQWICSATFSNSWYISANHEVVFINFYADWCRFSQQLKPIFLEASEKFKVGTLFSVNLLSTLLSFHRLKS